MKRNLLTLVTIGAIAAGGFAWAQDEKAPHGGPHGGPHGAGPAGMRGHGPNPLEHLAEALSLTPDQKTKIQPIIDQAKPQMKAIHEEAMQKAKALMDSTMAQIRPLLTPEQQTKADEMRKAHEDMHGAAKEAHDAKAE